MKKKLFVSLLLCLVLCLTMPLMAMAEGIDPAYVFDLSGLLQEAELSELEQSAAAIAQEYGCGVYLCVVDDYTEYTHGDIQSFAETAYEQLELGLGAERNGILLVMSMNDRDFWLAVHGAEALRAFTDYGQEIICENFLDDFRQNSWFTGFYSYIICSGELLGAAAAGTPVDVPVQTAPAQYSSQTGGVPTAPSGYSAPAVNQSSGGSSLLMIVLLPCIISLIICSGMAKSMKTAVKRTAATDYVSDGGTHMSVVQDRFLYSTRSVTVINNNNNNNRPGGVSGMSSRPGGTRVNSSGFSGRGGKF